MPGEIITPEQRRLRIIAALGSARPSHAWSPRRGSSPGCGKCPVRSPFESDMASHPYFIEEEL